MAYDETLADRIRAAATVLTGDVTERKMFGGLAFMLNGHMFAGVVGKDLMLRLGEPAASRALSRPHVREMDFTGRPMKGMVFVGPDGLNGPALGHWVAEAAAFAGSLPAKA
jgi:TfoX N-terminal domain